MSQGDGIIELTNGFYNWATDLIPELDTVFFKIKNGRKKMTSSGM
jgi:hypothetical protein